MDRITSLGRAILEALDTCEHGTGDTDVVVELYGPLRERTDITDVRREIIKLLDAELISARFRENPRDMACTADPIIYSITDAGCAALWALQKAEQATTPVRFESRAAMREYMAGGPT